MLNPDDRQFLLEAARALDAEVARILAESKPDTQSRVPCWPPPKGFVWAGEYRPALKGDWYWSESTGLTLAIYDGGCENIILRKLDTGNDEQPAPESCALCNKSPCRCVSMDQWPDFLRSVAAHPTDITALRANLQLAANILAARESQCKAADRLAGNAVDDATQDALIELRGQVRQSPLMDCVPAGYRERFITLINSAVQACREAQR